MKHKEIKEEYSCLGKYLSLLTEKLRVDWDGNKKFFDGVEYDSWEEFEGTIKELNKYLEDKEISTKGNPLLYRGQRCGEWGLETTLERYTDKEYTIMDYIQLIRSAKLAYESHFGKSYGTKEIDIGRIKYELGDVHPCYQLLSYFRHLGFPSPLLDWTRSFYVAAYFAFYDADPKDGKSVAVYTYIERFEGIKNLLPSPRGFIDRIGRNIATHKRHYLQQAEYTYAVSVDESVEENAMDIHEIDCNKLTYINHYEIIKDSMSESVKQDICVKHLVPITEKDEVINRLYSMNINEYSLFHTEESLMKTVAYERIKRKKQF